MATQDFVTGGRGCPFMSVHRDSVSGIFNSRKLRASGGVKKGRGYYAPALVVSDTLLKLTNLP